MDNLAFLPKIRIYPTHVSYLEFKTYNICTLMAKNEPDDKISFNLNNQQDYINKLIYLYHKNQYPICEDLAKRYLENYPNDEEVSAIEALAKIRQNHFDQVEAPLLQLLTKKQIIAMADALIMLIHYYLSHDNKQLFVQYAMKFLHLFEADFLKVAHDKAVQFEASGDLNAALKFFNIINTIKPLSKLQIKVDALQLHQEVNYHRIQFKRPPKIQSSSAINNHQQISETLSQLYWEERFDELKKLLQKFLKQYPNNQTGLLLQALYNFRCYGAKQKDIDFLNKMIQQPNTIIPEEIIFALQQYYKHTNQHRKWITYTDYYLANIKNSLSFVYFAFAKYFGIFDPHQAIECYTKSLVIAPNESAFANLISHCIYAHQYNKGIYWSKQALKIFPTSNKILIQYAIVLKYCVDFAGEKILQKLLKQKLPKKNLSMHPFYSIISFDDPKINFQIAKQFTKRYMTKFSEKSSLFNYNIKHNQPLNIAYVSIGFNDHPTGRMIANMFKHHDRRKFKIHCYSLIKNDNNYYTKMIKHQSDYFYQVEALSCEMLAKKINADNIDVLIDLDGHLAGNRFELFAYRPAPVQIEYLGFPGTTGASFIDYIIADEIIIPKEHQDYYSEKVIYMPHCYQVYSRKTDEKIAHLDKTALNLPADHFIFACLNLPHKYDKNSVMSWINIMQQVPNSTLILMYHSNTSIIKDKLIKLFKSHQISKERLVFWNFISKQEHLSRFNVIDLMLDTFTCNAHSSATDALSMGVPVLTLQGNHFCSRVCSSLLAYVGLNALITNSSDEYIQAAIDIANHPKKINCYQDILQTNFNKTLGNPALTVKHLEHAYTTVYAQYLSGKKPSTIHL